MDQLARIQNFILDIGSTVFTPISRILNAVKTRIGLVWRQITRKISNQLPPGFVDAAALPALLICCVSLLYFAAQFVTPGNVKQLSLGVRHATATLRSVVTMDGFIWVVLSWSLVGALCYYALNKLGITNSGEQVSSGKNGHPTTAFSGASNGANCDWANDLIHWLYGNLRRVPGPLDAWIKSLNDAAKKVTNPSKCEILFEGFGDHSGVTESLKLRNVRVQQGPRDHLTLRTDVHIPQMRLKLVSSQRNVQTMVVTNYDVEIFDLRGEIETRVACIAGQLYVMGCFSGRPEMDVQLKNTDSRASMEVDRGLVEDAIRKCLVSAVTNVNLSDGSASIRNSAEMSPPEPYKRLSTQGLTSPNTYSPANISSTPNPKLSRSPQTSFHTSFEGKPVDEMISKKLNNNQTVTPAMNGVNPPNKLKIKVIKAARLGKDFEVHHPYVVVETDEPPQRFQTTKGINANPYWEEQFDFELNPATEEMLFEVYEGKSNKSPSHDDTFLGLAIVNLEEIQRSPDSMHVLNLQGRPYRNDIVQGQLTCQFDYYYDPNVRVIGRVSDTVIVKDQNGGEFRETVSTQRRVVYDPHDNFDEAIPTKTTTVTVKTVTQSLKDKPAIHSVHGSLENAMDPLIQRQLDERLRERQIEPPVMSHSAYSNDLSNGSSEPPPRATSTIPPVTAVDDRQSRDRSKKMKEPKEKRDRSFFGAMKERLSGKRSKSAKRSKSFDLDSPAVQEAVSMPASRDQSRSRYDSDGAYMETASLGGKSGESNRSLYQHSTLVLELNHKGEKKYFLIPPSMVAEPAAAKLMKRGKKLHIYNEHTFVAVKCRSNIDCNVCHERIGRSFSKQAYQCRDCKMVSHKSCHYKSDAFCTHSNVGRLPIVKDVDWNHFLSNHQLEEFISMEGV